MSRSAGSSEVTVPSFVRSSWRFLSVALALAFVSPGLAHAYLEISVPEGGTTVDAMPAEIVLTLSEPVELRFSTFKVVRLEDAPTDRRALLEAAGALLEEVLPLRDDEELRADTGVLNQESTSAVIRIGMKEDLLPGTYVVMWRVLSVDTHTSEDLTLFHVGPAAER